MRNAKLIICTVIARRIKAHSCQAICARGLTGKDRYYHFRANRIVRPTPNAKLFRDQEMRKRFSFFIHSLWASGRFRRMSVCARVKRFQLALFCCSAVSWLSVGVTRCMVSSNTLSSPHLRQRVKSPGPGCLVSPPASLAQSVSYAQTRHTFTGSARPSRENDSGKGSLMPLSGDEFTCCFIAHLTHWKRDSFFRCPAQVNA
jgi:hypothetical protein